VPNLEFFSELQSNLWNLEENLTYEECKSSVFSILDFFCCTPNTGLTPVPISEAYCEWFPCHEEKEEQECY
jgi:hypothetical protein